MKHIEFDEGVFYAQRDESDLGPDDNPLADYEYVILYLAQRNAELEAERDRLQQENAELKAGLDLASEQHLPSYKDLESMYDAQCKCTDEWADKCDRLQREIDEALALISEHLDPGGLMSVSGAQKRHDDYLQRCKAFLEKDNDR